MSFVRKILWGLAAIAVAGFTLLLLFRGPLAPPTTLSSIGGPFRLTTQDGRVLSDADMKGRPFAVFFGYTFCPDVCPTTLWQLSEDLKALGKDGDRLGILFVTVDPERDTAEQLKTYLSAFDPRITGLTGERAAIDQAVRAYRVFYKKNAPPDGPVTFDHTAVVMLMDAGGRFVGTLDPEESREVQLKKLKNLLARGP